MKTTLFDCNKRYQLDLDGGTATINGQPFSTGIYARPTGNGYWLTYQGHNISFSGLTVEQANAINLYNAKVAERKATQTTEAKYSRPKKFVHANDYASVEEMLADDLAPVEVVRMRSQVNARKVSKDTFLLQAKNKLTEAQREFDELLIAWEVANKLSEEEFGKQLEQMRLDCNKQFAIERVAKLQKNDLQALVLELLAKL